MSHLWGGRRVIEIDIVIYFRYLEREFPLKYLSPMIVLLIWVTSSGSRERWPRHQKACILFTLLRLIHSESGLVCLQFHPHTSFHFSLEWMCCLPPFTGQERRHLS